MDGGFHVAAQDLFQRPWKCAPVKTLALVLSSHCTALCEREPEISVAAGRPTGTMGVSTASDSFSPTCSVWPAM